MRVKPTLSVPIIKNSNHLPQLKNAHSPQLVHTPKPITKQLSDEMSPKIQYTSHEVTNTDPAKHKAKIIKTEPPKHSIFNERQRADSDVSRSKINDSKSLSNLNNSYLTHHTKRSDLTLSSNQDYTKAFSPRLFVDEQLSSILTPKSIDSLRVKSHSPVGRYEDNLLHIKYGIVRDIKGLQKAPKKSDLWTEDVFEKSKYLNQIDRKQREIILKYALPKKNAIEQRKIEKLKTSKHFSKALYYIQEYPQQDEWAEWIADIKKANDRPEENELNDFRN